MTDREEIVEELENVVGLIKQDGKDWLDERDIPLLEFAIEALKSDECEDCVSRQVAIVALDDRMSSLENVDMQIAMGFAKGIINELPSVTPAKKVGHWIDCSNGWMCSACSRDCILDSKYCPNCGAKMQEVEG